MSTPLLLDIRALPGSITLSTPLSDQELERMCAASDILQFERTKEGEIRINPPTELSTSGGTAEIIYQLNSWWRTHRRGMVTDSNAGFFLEDGSMLSPDAAYLTPERLKTVSKRGLPHVCPDFVIELLSRSDSFRQTQIKMKDWIANGAVLAWLIDPYKRRAFIYRPGEGPVEVSDDSICGIGPVDGFVLNLIEVWRFYNT